MHMNANFKNHKEVRISMKNENQFERDHTIWREFKYVKEELAEIRRLIMLTMPPEIANKINEENTYRAFREYQDGLSKP